ncbi:MAG: methylaspartate mutase subunit E, partial [Clostridiaceae bacterium]|nr:methylaspartate mutase subunit E [Clostridiaceae bacterium]
MELKNQKWTNDEFFEVRKEVLNQWPTGKEVDLEEAIEYNKKIPDHKNFAKKLVKAKEEGITLAQPRAGVALIDKHIELLNFLEQVGGADLLPST